MSDKPKRQRPKPINLGQMGIVANSTPSLPAIQPLVIPEEPQQMDIYRRELYDKDLQVLEELGMGSGGTVFRVLHIPSNSIMARKNIVQSQLPTDSNKDGFSDEVARELKILEACRSAYVIDFYGAYMAHGELCVCMEFMDVGSLERISKLTRGGVSDLPLQKIALSVLRGLVYLYEKHRIVHRDIKPSNILINSQGKVKLCDFGVSSQLETASFANTFVGTGAYMSPERIMGQKYSTEADTWSMGLTLLELALGRFPFLAETQADVEIMAQFSPFDLLDIIVNAPIPTAVNCSLQFQQFLGQCLQRQGRPSPVALLLQWESTFDSIIVDMVQFSRQYLEPNLNAAQVQRWSMSQKQKRTSLLQNRQSLQQRKKKLH